jgi:cyclic pyranopterin phosphate synthase
MAIRTGVEGTAPTGAVVGVAPRAVRVSLTDRCDLACIYCRPHRHDGYFAERMGSEGWRTLARALFDEGIERVRFTGGEPLLHREAVEIVRDFARLPFRDLALTTNGVRLARFAAPLRDAGLHRVTVSLDSLHPDRFRRMTRGGDLAPVLEGIDAMLESGFAEPKMNTVVVRGENDDELVTIAQFALSRGITPRFLEVMLVGEGARFSHRVVDVREMRSHLGELLEDAKSMDPDAPDPDRGPARYAAVRNMRHARIGFISGTSHTYCQGCDRLRVTAAGGIRPCLATTDETSSRSEAEQGDSEAVRARIRDAWLLKPDGTQFRGCTEPTARDVSMRSTGG